jgi:cytochrome c553
LTRAPAPRAGAPPSAPIAAVALLAVLALAAPGDAASVEERVAPCLGCHGAGGRSEVPETPSLGGQPAFFVTAQLFLFREGRRSSAPMTEAAKTLTDDDLRAFAERIAKLPPPAPPPDPPDPARLARGVALTRRRPCAVCHNPDFSGRDQMPRLAHQREDYLLKAMREYQSGARIGYAGAMAVELVGLADADLRDLAHFLSHLPAPTP